MPIGPKKFLLLIGSGVAGFIISIISCFFKKALSLTVNDPDTLINKTGIPVMAIIPHNLDSKAEKSRFFVEDRFKDSHVNEIRGNVLDSFRVFRSSLISNHTGGLEKIIAFTSGSSGVGKSFVATNFAIVLALGGNRVLLIDGDPRKNSFL
jgi:tyrosine-protein kinase Etk/Wzc